MKLKKLIFLFSIFGLMVSLFSPPEINAQASNVTPKTKRDSSYFPTDSTTHPAQFDCNRSYGRVYIDATNKDTTADTFRVYHKLQNGDSTIVYLKDGADTKTTVGIVASGLTKTYEVMDNSLFTIRLYPTATWYSATKKFKIQFRGFGFPGGGGGHSGTGGGGGTNIKPQIILLN